MAIYKVQNMTLVAQPEDGVCWYASLLMLYKWSKATGNGSMKSPDDDSGFATRAADNGDWFCGQNGYMADTLKLKKFTSLPMEFGELNAFLVKHGPVFTSVQKNWSGNNYSHAVVIGGVADTGVFIYDPMPVKQGSSTWLTWSQIQKAIDGVAKVADYQFLTVV